MEILWTAPAEAHLRAIRAFHAQTSTRFADRLVDRITIRTSQLAAFPRSEAVVPEAENIEVRQLVEGDYRILYVVAAENVIILGALHGARRSL